ncbi:transcription factor bHLH106-like [Wolffia australiana]
MIGEEPFFVGHQLVPEYIDAYHGVEIDQTEFGLCGYNQGMEAMAWSIPSLFSPFDPVEKMASATDEGPLDRAAEAAKNHREAEKRRRGRINSHLDRLRAILACDSKIDKASLLAKAVQHVRELKRRAAEIHNVEDFPSETDEIAVYPDSLRPLFTASLCCEDRAGLLPELGEAVKSLRLRILRAEIATLGGRVRNVLVVGGEDGGADGSGGGRAAAFLKEALRGLVDRPGGAAAECQKRRRLGDGAL